MHRPDIFPSKLLLFITTLFLLSACEGAPTEQSSPPEVTAIKIISENSIQNAVGDTFPTPLVTQIVDQNGLGIEGIDVNWWVEENGGTLTPSFQTTDIEGYAQSKWIPGTIPGEYTIVASMGEALTAYFKATVTRGPLTRAEVLAGNNQTGEVATQLPEEIRIKATDDYGNSIPYINVAWTVLSGSVQGEAYTDSTGVARARWTLGGQGATQSLWVTLTEAEENEQIELEITAQAKASGVAQVVKKSGDLQSSPVRTSLSYPLVIYVEDALGRPVPDQETTWTVQTSAGGEVSQAIVKTTSDGRAINHWTLGEKSGLHRVRVTADGQAAIFEAIALPGSAKSIEKLRGDRQEGPGGKRLSDHLEVLLKDEFGNPALDGHVTWTPENGSGSASAQSSRSDSLGVAKVYWTLGDTQDVQYMIAALDSSRVTFSATRTEEVEEPKGKTVIRSRKNTEEGIIALCGESWEVSKADAIKHILQEEFVYYSEAQGVRALIEVINGASGYYLRSKPDSTEANNLDNLPDC